MFDNQQARRASAIMCSQSARSGSATWRSRCASSGSCQQAVHPTCNRRSRVSLSDPRELLAGLALNLQQDLAAAGAPPLLVWNRSPDKAEPLVKAGAQA